MIKLMRASWRKGWQKSLGQWGIRMFLAHADDGIHGREYINTSVDALPASLDSALYKGGQYLFGGANGANIAAFSGDPMQGTIVTGEAAIKVVETEWAE